MFNFTSKYPTAKNIGNSTKGLTKSKISENAQQAAQSALDIVEDIGSTLVDKITSAIDGIISGVASTVESVVDTIGSIAKSAVDTVTNAYNSIEEFLTSDNDDNAIYIKSLSTSSETDELLGVNDYVDNALSDDKVTAENGVVQKNLSGNINNLSKTLTNKDKRDIAKYTDKKLEKVQEIKKQCSNDLVEYAVETSNEKFTENNDSYDNIGIDMSNIDYNCINIKTIKVVITSDEQ